VSHAGPKTRRYLPAWFWVIVSLAGVVILLFGGGTLVAGLIPKPGTDTAEKTAVTRPTSTPTVIPTPTASATTAPVVAAAVPSSRGVSTGGASTLSSDDISAIETAVSAHDTATIQTYLGASVGVVITSSGQSGSQDAGTALSELSSMFTNTDPWSFTVDPTQLAHYRQGNFGAYFPSKAIIGTSTDGHVISLIPSGGTIIAMLIASDNTLLLAN
jgi:hypothetical protein